jgi:hypothetical protein
MLALFGMIIVSLIFILSILVVYAEWRHISRETHAMRQYRKACKFMRSTRDNDSDTTRKNGKRD